MVENMETYLQELKAALVSTGADPALVQDALFDAEEYLQAEMAAREQAQPGDDRSPSGDDRAAWFAAVIEGYGTPEEVAAAYVGTTPPDAEEPTRAPVSEPESLPTPPDTGQPRTGTQVPRALHRQPQSAGAAVAVDQLRCCWRRHHGPKARHEVLLSASRHH